MSDLFRFRDNVEHWLSTAQVAELALLVELVALEVLRRGGPATRYVVTAVVERALTLLAYRRSVS